MKTRKGFWIVAAACCCVGVFAQTAAGPTADAAARRAGKREAMLRRTGGFLLRVPEGAKAFKVVNAQKAVPTAALASVVRDMGRFTSSLVKLEETEKTVNAGNASARLAETGAAGGVFIVDEASLPISLVAQEARWGIVNVAALRTAGVDAGTLAARTVREAWRVFSLVAGAGDTSMGHCLLKPVFRPEDLDEAGTNSISPEPLPAMGAHLKAMGVGQVSRVTYLEACREGWAPPPTNDIQRAVWERTRDRVK